MKILRYRKIVQQVSIGLFSLACTVSLHAQNQDDQPKIDIKTGIQMISNFQGMDKKLPYWMHVNRDGRVDQHSANALHYIDAETQVFENTFFDIDASASLTSRYSETPLSFINKAYLNIEALDFELTAGRFLDPLALKGGELSTGSFMISRNATPIPKVAFSTSGFNDVPGTNGIVRYNSLLAHGWFEEDRYVKNAYLHEKYFYLSIKYNFFDAVGGIVHNVQWAGESRNENVGKLPSGLDTYWEVFSATGSSDDGAPGGERSNAVGNSVAAYDFSFGIFFDQFNFRAYRLFYLEDKISTRFRSPWDGIWRFTVKPKNFPQVQNIIWEHINTKRQDSFDFEPRGSASYYNNFVYRSGWTYGRRVIGNPMLTTDDSINQPTINNIIVAHHAGLAGEITPNLEYTFLYTWSRNYGIWQDQAIEVYSRGPIKADLRPMEEVKEINHSLMLQLRSSLPNNERFRYGLTLASDFGEFYGDRFGVGLNIEYQLVK